MAPRKVSVLGLGRIGLPTAACLAEAGFEVVGVDIDHARLDAISAGEIDASEPGLRQLVELGLSSGRLRLRTEPEPADVFILCLPTPLAKDNRCDLDALDGALRSVAGVIGSGNLIVLESTVPVHTTRDHVLPLLRSLGLSTGVILVAYAPERIMSGRMLEELRNGDRIIGGITPAAADAAKNLYSRFVKGNIHLTDTSTAELVKIIENTYRDINIAFANEIALFCDREGMDAWRAIELANRHPRVHIHQPGPGVGGHCIPVVPYFLAQATKHNTMINSARQVNESMPRYLANMILREVAELERPKVAIMGASYKANTRDPINSVAQQVLRHLEGEDLQVVICDPLVHEPGLNLVDLPEALTADCLVFLVRHDIFRELDPPKPFRGRGTVIDGADCIDLQRWEAQGWTARGFAKAKPG